MYKLLIVDDDPWMRELLIRRIHWKNYGFAKVVEAVNGLQAMAEIEADPPHILLTDIKMDGMNGIELLSRVREQHPDIRVILLSEYSEFEYARMAVKKGVVDYLLKPIVEEELISLVQRTLKVIEQEKFNREREQKIFRQLTQSLPMLQEKFVKDLITGNMGPANVLEHFPDSDLKINFTAFYLMIVEIDNYSLVSGSQNS